MEILAVFIIIIAIGTLLAFVGILMDNDLSIIGISVAIIMLIFLLLIGGFGMILSGTTTT